MQLRIEHQFGQVGINASRASLNLTATRAQLEMDTQPARLEIDAEPPRIHIDQSQCFADAGLRSPARFAAYKKEQAQQDFAEGVAKIVSKGDELQKINKASIADVAREQSPLNARVEYNVKAIPQQPPEIWFDLSPVRFNYQPAAVTIKVRPGEVRADYQPAVTEIYEKQKALLKIEWVGNNYDEKA